MTYVCPGFLDKLTGVCVTRVVTLRPMAVGGSGDWRAKQGPCCEPHAPWSPVWKRAYTYSSVGESPLIVITVRIENVQRLNIEFHSLFSLPRFSIENVHGF